MYIIPTYKNKTWCIRSNQDCGNTKCPFFFGEDEHEVALKWWGADGYPIAYTDLKDTANCEFIPLIVEEKQLTNKK